MGKLKVYIYILIFLIANKAVAQSIDTVTIKIDFPFGYEEAHCTALKVEGDTISEFTTAEMDDYSFKWSGDFVPSLDSLSKAVYVYNADASYNIRLSLVEKAINRTINADTVIVIQTPVGLVVPNVFTPNADGVNDRFKVFYDGVTELEITIFTRTGVKVFNSKAPSIVWDGYTASGGIASDGIYYYVITAGISDISTNGFFYLYSSK